jgi:adenine-specific DNA-methyltransferase
MAKKDYSTWTKEELLRRLKELEKRKKYGLVWDEEKGEEQFEKESKDKLPVLKEVKKNEIVSDKENSPNILIEGDNYHALSVLNYTHKGKIDVIYIDPPYNTGSENFVYNDNRYNNVKTDDPYRHSKWIAFMARRLRLARDLLTNKGVIFISIDDNEVAQLKLLCDEIFGENRLGMMVWRKSGDGRDGKMKNTTTYRTDHEYIVICFKQGKNLNKLLEKPNFKGKLTNPDNDLRGNWLSGSISRKETASNPNHKNYYEVKSPSGKKHTRQWDIPFEEFLKLDKDNRIFWGPKGSNVPRIKIFEAEERSITPYSILLNSGTTTEGTKEVNEILGGDYSGMRPKPKLLIQTLIQLSSTKNSIILDFFAGTGTTLHAVFKQNKKDGGKRKVILCTSNENNICTDVCYPRIEKVINGYKNSKGEKVEGLGGNLKYFKTDFVDAEPTDKNKIKLTREATEMLCLKEDTFEPVLEKDKLKIFRNREKYTGIILDHRGIKEFKKAIKDIKGNFHIYVFSVGDDTFDEEFEDLEQKHKLMPIPEVILRVYRRIYSKL